MALSKELSRLARFGANITDAYSCFIFLPQQLLNNIDNVTQSSTAASSTAGKIDADYLGLVGYHSLSNDIVPSSRLDANSGLIGWVAKHNRSIHVSPFERDSRTLGVYSEDQTLKSFIGIPIPIESGNQNRLAGVLACDSKKSFAFSKLQGKLLEELALEVTCVVSLLQRVREKGESQTSMAAFLKRGIQVAETVGPASLEVIRFRVSNYDELESIFGTMGAVQFVEQTYRLITQALPPHFPLFRGPTGELIVILDNMMSSFFENKIHAICAHTGIEVAGAPRGQKTKVEFAFSKRAFQPRTDKGFDIERLVSESAFDVEKTDEGSKTIHLTPRKAAGFA